MLQDDYRIEGNGIWISKEWLHRSKKLYEAMPNIDPQMAGVKSFATTFIKNLLDLFPQQ